MEITQKQVIVMIVMIFGIVSASVLATQLPVTMEEGQEDVLDLGSQSYDVEVLIIEDTSPPTVTFKINRQITSQLFAGSSQPIHNVILRVLEIVLNEGGEAGSGDIVTFTFEYCGDSICALNERENCEACPRDCGCSSSQFCYGNSCRVVRCGDGLCSPHEDCKRDNCCNGASIDDFNYDMQNCGNCNVRCGYQKGCIQGSCKKTGSLSSQEKKQRSPVCGNSICEKGENCCTDCGCAKRDFKCIQDVCVNQNQCKTDQSCEDQNPCTKDQCQGFPKKCVNTPQEGCILGATCVPTKEHVVINDVDSYCSEENIWVPFKEEGVTCSADDECESNRCEENRCYVERPPSGLTTFFQWMKELFYEEAEDN